MKVLRDNVLVKPDEDTKKTKSGILIPDSEVETTQKGTVVERGQGYYLTGTDKLVSVSLNKDDKVVYNKNIGQKVVLDDVEYRILREADILMVINN